MNPAPIRVLHLESERMYSEYLRLLLKRRGGFHVSSAENRRGAIERAMNADYDVCILNLAQPYSNGIAHAEQIHDRNPELPMIFFTGAIRKDFDHWAEKLTFRVAYLPKNSTNQAIFDKIAEVLVGEGWWEPAGE